MFLAIYDSSGEAVNDSTISENCNQGATFSLARVEHGAENPASAPRVRYFSSHGAKLPPRVPCGFGRSCPTQKRPHAWRHGIVRYTIAPRTGSKSLTLRLAIYLAHTHGSGLASRAVCWLAFCVPRPQHHCSCSPTTSKPLLL